jgi:hypothetical protein
MSQKALSGGTELELPLPVLLLLLVLPPEDPPAPPDEELSGALFAAFVAKIFGTRWKTAVSGSETAIRADPELMTVTDILCGFKDGNGVSPDPSTVQIS